MTGPIVHLAGVSKRYGDVPALRNLMMSEPEAFNSATNASSVASGLDDALNALLSAPAIDTDERPAGSLSSTN